MQRRLEIIVIIRNALWACRVLCYVVYNTVDNIAVTRKNYYFITKLNLTFPRTRTEPNPGSPRTRLPEQNRTFFINLTRTRTEPYPNN